jgi:hypothetical protein
MSSHREAPEISQDPVADNTDTYAFVSPDAPDTVTIISNYIPLEAAASGPNFYAFGDDVRYRIYISNDGTSQPNIAYEFHFTTHILDGKTFLYNTGPISSIYDKTFNNRQTYSVSLLKGTDAIMDATSGINKKPSPHVIGNNLACPPCNIGPSSTPNYPALAAEAVHELKGGVKVFAGQRNDGFFADLGAIFDLADLRPFQSLHLASMVANAPGIDTLGSGINVHTIAIQVPISQLTRNGTVPTDVMASDSTIGVWASASRRKMQVRPSGSTKGSESGPWVQVSRLGNPLFNEVLVGVTSKDEWNRSYPADDKNFADGVLHPGLSALLPTLYPDTFPALASLNASGKPRADLEAILLTGLPAGVVPGFQNNTGKVLGDMLRLNVAVPPSANPSPAGLVGGDAAGFPNGRRVIDDVVTIELRALAGLTYSLVDPSFTPDPAAKAVTDGVAEPSSGAAGYGSLGGDRFLTTFPYLGSPYDGYDVPEASAA